MKIEANLLISKIKKDKFWIISYIVVLAVAVAYCLFNDENIFSNNKTFYLLIGYPKNLTNDKFIYTLINLYTIVYFIYFTITYFNYELENYCDNLIIREKSKKWIIRKTLAIILSIILIKTLNIISVLFLYNYSYPFDYKIIFFTLTYYVTISIISILINIVIKNNAIVIILSLISSTLIFHYIENLITLFAIIIISLIFIITYFNFKKIFKLKYN